MIFRHKNLADSTGRVYRHLFDNIVYNRLKPGAALSETEIAATLSVSRTPVREAMMILEGEGIITRYPSRGCFVAHVSESDVQEIFELRTLLEMQALRSSFLRIEEERLDNLRQALDALLPDSPNAEYFETDRELHRIVLEYCGNARLVSIVGVLGAQIERLRVVSADKPKRLIQSRLEHIGIVGAIVRRDLPEAEKLLAHHIGNVRDSTLEVCRYLALSRI